MIGLIKGTARQVKTVSGLPLPIASYKSNSKSPLKALSLSINPTQSGSGDPAPDNIRPITGVSSVNVADMSDITDLSYFQGVLKGTHKFVILDGTTNYGWVGGGNSVATTAISGGVVTNASTQSNVYTKNSNPNFNNASWVRRNADKPSIGMYYGASSLFIKSDDITSADEAKAYFTSHPTTVIYELATPITPTITPSEFVALLTEFGINGWCVNVQLGDTYYGATLDVVRGKLMVTNAGVDLGSLNWVKWTGDQKGFYAGLNPQAKGVPSTSLESGVCESLKPEIYSNVVNGTVDCSFHIANTTHILYAYRSDLQNLSASDFKTAISGTMLVYELATPIEIDLTPTQINSLLGQNHIWHDGNGDVEVLKFMDRQLYFGR